jgi:hypothetical protein
MHAMSVEKTATEDALASARRATEVERVGRADAERLIKHCQDHCEELQVRLPSSYHKGISQHVRFLIILLFEDLYDPSWP